MRIALPLFLAVLCLPAIAADRQPVDSIEQAARNYLLAQIGGSAPDAEVVASLPDSRLSLPACQALEAFLPPGFRVAGNTVVAVRCNSPVNWTVHVPVRVRVMGEIVVASRPLASGQLIGPADVVLQKADLGQAPAGALTDASQLVGKVLNSYAATGQPLRQEMLRTLPAIQQGQMVRLVSVGRGFRVSAEAQALGNGPEGRVVQVRVASGQLISGIARPGGIVEVSY